MTEVVIVSAVRSAVARGKADGALASVHPVDLSAAVMREAHLSLSVNFEVSMPPIDRLAGLVAEALGDSGGVRLTGAGFGGCLVAVTAHEATTAIDDAVARYNTAADLPARAETFRPVGGAAPIRL